MNARPVHPSPRRIVAAVSALVALALAPACAATSTPAAATGASEPSTLSRQTTVPGGASTSSPADPGTPGSSKDHPLPIGTEITPANGWSITVTAAADLDAGAALAKDNPLIKPKPGEKLVTVSLKVHNGDSKAGSLALNANPFLTTPSGTRIASQAIPPASGGLTPYNQLPPGGTNAGKLVYGVPTADAPNVVLLVEPVLGRKITPADLRFLAIR